MKKEILRDNYNFSKLEYEEVRRLLSKYKIDYRKKINIDSNITFGLEIEFENAILKIINRCVKFYNYKWQVVEEQSIRVFDNNFNRLGGEIKSPILLDNDNSWKELRDICDILESNGAFTWEKCGGHVNIGSQILNNNTDSWFNLLKVWAIYEHIIYRFAYGISPYARCNINKFAKPMVISILNLINQYKNIDISESYFVDLLEPICEHKVCGIDFCDVKGTTYEKDNTIEIRCPNGSIHPIIWQNNVNFFTKMISLCNNVDSDYLNYKLKTMTIYELEDYSKIYYKDAVELADLVFDNNLDKFNFLKQYFKNNNKGLKKVKKFNSLLLK